MALLTLLLLVLTNYVIVADMPSNSKIAYGIVVGIICLLVVLTKFI